MTIKGNVVILAFCFSFGACAALLVDKNTHDYPQASKDIFMSSCMKNSGGKQEYCSCMLLKVQEHYTYGELTDVEQKIKSGQPPAEFTDFTTQASQACLIAGSVQR